MNAFLNCCDVLKRTCLTLFVATIFSGVVYAAELARAPILVIDAAGHTVQAGSVLFTRDGQGLISVSHDKTIRLWDVASGECLRTLRPPIGNGFAGKISHAALSPDGTKLAFVGWGWPAESGELHFPVFLVDLIRNRIERVFTGHTATLWNVAYSADGKHLASCGSDNTARLWNIETGKCEHVLAGPKGHFDRIIFSNDGRHVVSTGIDHTAEVWSVTSGESVVALRGHESDVRAAAWSPDGKTIATGCADRCVRFWDTDGKLLRKVPGFGSELSSLTFTNDSRKVFYSCFYSAPGVIDVESGRRLQEFRGEYGTIWSGTLSPDSSRAAVCDGRGDLWIWDMATARKVGHFKSRGEGITAAAWSPDGATIAWGTAAPSGTANEAGALQRTFDFERLELGTANKSNFQRAQEKLQDLKASRSPAQRSNLIIQQDGRQISEIKLWTKDRIHAFTLLPERQVALGSDFVIGIFNAESGQRIREFQGHTSAVRALAASPNHRYLLSGSMDRTLRIWRLDQNQPLLSLFVADNDWIAWTPEGYFAASPGGEQLMGWQVNAGPEKLATFHPAAQFRGSLYRPDVIKVLLKAGSLQKAIETANLGREKAPAAITVSQVLPPFVVVTRPDKPQSVVSEGAVEIHFVAKPIGAHPLTSVRLLLDGRPSPEPEHVRTFSTPQPNEVRESWTVKLDPGMHRLAVQAETSASKGVSEPVEVFSGARGFIPRSGSDAAKQPPLPCLYVLAIGISAYPEKLKLQYATRDAEAIAETCRQHSASLFRKVEMKVLTDKNARRKDILQGLTWLRKQMTQNDVAIISFAGHGAKDSDGTFYLLPTDVDPEDLLSTGVPGEQLKRALAGMPGKFLVLLDACHSGAVDGEQRRGSGAATDDLVRDLVTDDYGVIVMCSAMGREFALESPTVKHGYFTMAIVEGLQGKADYNQDNVVHLNELDLYVTDRVKVLSNGRQHPVTARPTSIRSFPLSNLPATGASMSAAPGK